MVLLKRTSVDTTEIKKTIFYTFDIERPLQVKEGQMLGVSADVGLPFMMEVDEVS